MRTVKFSGFWLLVALGMAIVTSNSCNKEDEQEVTSISLDTLALTLAINKEYTLAATVLPENATDKTVIWTSNANAIASVSNGKVTAISKGTATITAKAGNQTNSCIVTVMDLTYDEGVVINGIKWATRNVDAPGIFAANPEDAGMFYQWNRKKAWPATGEVTDWDTTVSNSSFWTKFNDPSPVGWHVPEIDEIILLLKTDQVSNEWTTVNGINGCKFTDITTGNSLFLPAVGSRFGLDDGTLYGVDLYGNYWCSTKYEDFPYVLHFHDVSVHCYWADFRNVGFSVRSVAD